jgi:hypothetical protein
MQVKESLVDIVKLVLQQRKVILRNVNFDYSCNYRRPTLTQLLLLYNRILSGKPGCHET